MGIRFEFNSEANPNCKGMGPEFTGLYLKSKESYWNQFKQAYGNELRLADVLRDLGCDIITKEMECGYWPVENSNIDFGITFDENGSFLLNFNCDLREPEPKKKKPCYFWNLYKYHVTADQLTLRGFIDWCNELYAIQYKKQRPKNNRIFVNPDLKVVTVNARFWNKDAIEKWLNDHGYKWTVTVETRYQYRFDNPDEVELIDSDAALKARHSA